jgi:hypothetical protein
MGCDVYANGNAIACKAGDGKAIASFPDVCLSPPSPPAGPVPVPYPNTSFDKDMQAGSKSVVIKGKEVMLKDQSFFKTSPLGNEAATNGLGAGVVTHVITGKTFFVAWSMDVQFEGQNVDRNLDLTTSNHASPPGNTGPVVPKVSEASPSTIPEDEQCPCCKGPMHANQVNPATGKRFEAIKERDWYGSVARYYTDRRAQVPNYPQLPDNVKSEIIRKGDEAEAANNVIQSERAGANCENLHDPEDEECGTHLKNTNPGSASEARKEYTSGIRNASIREYKNKGYAVRSNNSSVAHKTPLEAGGCPISPKNLVPNDVIDAQGPPCTDIEAAQTLLANRTPNKDLAKLF